MIITVIQAPYYTGECPDEKIAGFLLAELEKGEKDSLLVLPEYSNAGGVSDVESERKAMSRAKSMLEQAARIAKMKSVYVAINVLEDRDGSIKNSTYLLDKEGNAAFVYDKIHLPPSEIAFGIERGEGPCICMLDGIRFGFLTCYDVYFNEQIEFLAMQKPDIIIIPSYQRGERVDMIEAQAKLIAFRCNAYVARASYSMNDNEHGGCSMIVSPDGRVLKNIGKGIGSLSADIDPKWKYMRSAGFGGGKVRNDDFINSGLCGEVFQ